MVIERIGTDILVIGGGLAGAFAAIKAKEAGIEKVMLVSKGKLGKDSISTFGAGIFIMVSPDDDRDIQSNHCISALGEGLYDEEWLNIFLDEVHDRALDMEKWGVEWEKTPDGKFERKEVRYKQLAGMFHGPQMMEAMTKKVISSGVEVVSHTMVTDLLTEDGNPKARVTGAVGFNVRNGQFKVFKAKSTILAAGGCGFKGRNACHRFQTGDAATMSYRAGVKLGQFEVGGIIHMTAADFPTQGASLFVGLGGKFVNAIGERFMLDYDPELEDLASLQRVSEASAMEVRAGRGPIYLDMTHFTPELVNKLRTVLPIPTIILERVGVLVGDKIVKKIEWIPVFVGAIARGGGVVVNSKCEASLPGLYACGDAMALNPSEPAALAGAAISGARAGTFAVEYTKEMKEPTIDEGQVEELKEFAFAPLGTEEGVDPDHIIIRLGEVLFPYEVTVISRGDRLEKAIKEVVRIRDEEVPLMYASDAHYLRLANEAKNMVLFAEMYLRSRLLRKESRRSCVREDYPYTDNLNWLKWTRLKQENGKMLLWTEDIPVESYKIEPKREKYLYPVFEVAGRKGIKWG
ncbi:FAD-dependent oxidoreductase [Chloroflexota bacterium]